MSKGIYIIGCAKAGTTFLHNNLARSLQISSNTNIKEPGYHARSVTKHLSKKCIMSKKNKFIFSQEDYIKLFDNKLQYHLDSSTIYLPFSEQVIPSILDYHNNRIEEIFIIVILRNPYERIISQYQQMCKNQVEFLSLDEALREERNRVKKKYHPFYYYSKYALIAKHLVNFDNHFQNLLILNYDDLEACPEKTVAKAFNFLNLGMPKKLDLTRYNKTGKGMKSDFLHSILTEEKFKTLRQKLMLFFSPNIKNKVFNYLYYNNFDETKTSYNYNEEEKVIINNDILALESYFDLKLSKWKN